MDNSIEKLMSSLESGLLIEVGNRQHAMQALMTGGKIYKIVSTPNYFIKGSVVIHFMKVMRPRALRKYSEEQARRRILRHLSEVDESIVHFSFEEESPQGRSNHTK